MPLYDEGQDEYYCVQRFNRDPVYNPRLDCGRVTFTKTAGPRAVARLNKLCERVYFYGIFNRRSLLQKNMLPVLNDDFVFDRSTEWKNGYITFKKLAEDLSGRYGLPPYSCRAAEFDIVLELEIKSWSR